MIADPAVRAAVTAVFGVAAVLCVVRASGRVHDHERVGSVFHIVMCAAMVGMAWSWGTTVAVLPDSLFFGFAALWFVAVAAIYHAVMMASMAWMVVVMAVHLHDGSIVALTALLFTGLFLAAGGYWLARWRTGIVALRELAMAAGMAAMFAMLI